MRDDEIRPISENISEPLFEMKPLEPPTGKIFKLVMPEPHTGPGIAPLSPPTPETLELARTQVPGVDFPVCTVDEATGERSIIYCPYVPILRGYPTNG